MAVCLLSSPVLAGQVRYGSTQQQFEQLFVTAGYSTAFGAALGAAAIGLTTNPAENMRFISIGASMGFMAGSLIGTYVILNPMAAAETVPSRHDSSVISQYRQPSGNFQSFTIQPQFNEQLQLKGAEAHFVLAQF
ncbi:MAG: hypothetical protein OXT67_01785 [Zetaproteobacteria bacterium]|nr:hypothetical protein [Zetaproteobacteria bacterium]